MRNHITGWKFRDPCYAWLTIRYTVTSHNLDDRPVALGKADRRKPELWRALAALCCFLLKAYEKLLRWDRQFTMCPAAQLLLSSKEQIIIPSFSSVSIKYYSKTMSQLSRKDKIKGVAFPLKCIVTEGSRWLPLNWGMEVWAKHRLIRCCWFKNYKHSPLAVVTFIWTESK